MDSMSLSRSSVPADQWQAATVGKAAGEYAWKPGYLGVGKVGVPSSMLLFLLGALSPSTSLLSLENPITLPVSAQLALHSCNTYLLSTYPVLGIILTIIHSSKQDGQNLCLHGLIFLCGRWTLNR